MSERKRFSIAMFDYRNVYINNGWDVGPLWAGINLGLLTAVWHGLGYLSPSLQRLLEEFS